ncbi:MAG: HNH endonuclease [Nitrospira sp.]|nr:HNH endonuclease [Nitrospira sp.]
MLTIRLVPPPSQQKAGDILLKVLVYTAVGVLAYKGLQAILDEDFGGGEYPRRFREEMRQEHMAWYGCCCPQCGRRVPYDDLTVDHVVSMKNGGCTSRANADLMCRSCNSQKGGKNSFFDYIRGRSY